MMLRNWPLEAFHKISRIRIDLYKKTSRHFYLPFRARPLIYSARKHRTIIPNKIDASHCNFYLQMKLFFTYLILIRF